MNQDSSANSGNSEMEEVVDDACRDFELKFRDNSAFRIEDLVAEVSRYVSRFGSDSKRDAARDQIIAELIFVEMDLRLAAGQAIVTQEYLDRFPGFEPAIFESLNRIRKLHDGFQENCSVVTVSINAGDVVGNLQDELHVDSDREMSVPEELGPYRDIAEINSGGFGIVCRAIDSRDGQVVALKFPRKDKLKDDPELKMFLAEASKAMMLEHPGIVRTFSIERADGFLAIVQQFVDGSDLKATKHQTRSHKEIARLVGLVAEALAFAHQKGIYHRDLKPGNILIDRQGRPYVADFGLAVSESEQMFLPKQTCGTPHYMPPEQVAGLTRLLDGRSDIWSLGVILYELLTKRRPFEGLKTTEVFEQIENKDPRPPRQIDSSISQELQRICLKCMERQQRDRYPTADELADDLRHWAESEEAPKTVVVDVASPMIPKGLRSYSAEDAAFFLDLLPGPRDRSGLPGSIRFWKTRIVEPVASENRVPVGVIFGPSGSGKSSFVKAGLLPQFGREVLTLYIEATQADTEVRLLRALRQRLVDVPDEISLPDLFRGLGFGHWLPAPHTKLLIVIDQFEQRLSRADDPESSQLARALRYCDGEHLQCLLLTRDDFMMALSRFVDALEMDLREGENAQAIDLFDRKHAKKVLTKLGRAYDRLPAEPMALSEVEESFLEEAVDQLAEDNHVICVRLALFAEMFRHRPWTPTELKQVGGVAGTGEKFLEETFGPGSRDKRLRLQREPAQRVLEALLPAAGIDIRGAMKPETDLVAAAKMQNQLGQFEELVKTLDFQLKLITRTDPDHTQGAEPQVLEASGSGGWFQLTHDYLVLSVRRWLDSTLGTTRAGRARLRLRDLAAQMIPGQPPRILPTHPEWLSWRVQIPQESLAENERVLMRAASRRFARQTSWVMAILLLLGTLGAIGYNHMKVNSLINALITQEVDTVPGIVAQLKQHPILAEPRLRAQLDNSLPQTDKRNRVLMGLLPFDSSVSSKLIDSIVNPDCQPDKLESIVTILKQNGFNDVEQLSRVLNDPASSPGSRLRSLCAQIAICDGNGDWEPFAGLAANALLDEPITSADRWITFVDPVGDQFLAKFSEIFSDFEEQGKSLVLARALFSFLSPDERLTNFAKFLGQADESRFDAILSTIEEKEVVEEFADSLEKQMAESLEPEPRTNMNLALMRLGREKNLVEQYSGDFEQVSTILAINLSTARRVRLHSLRRLYEKHLAGKTENVNLRRSVLQALALQSAQVFDQSLKDWLEQISLAHVTNDPDACCFSTAELILSRLGNHGKADWRKVRKSHPLCTNGILGNVLIDRLGQAFSVIEYVDDDGKSSAFAISITELTIDELHRFQGVDEIDENKTNSGDPWEIQDANDFQMAYQYCNWLCCANGLGNDDLCYPTNVPIEKLALTPADTNKNGYRLPTVEEWIIANRSNRVLERMKDLGSMLVTNYAWVFENTRGKVQEVGNRLPNADGLFDSFGNLQEICQHHMGDALEFYELGKSVRAELAVLSVDKDIWRHQVIQRTKTRQGVRIAFTIQ